MMKSLWLISLTALNSRITQLKKRLGQPADSNLFLITVTSLVKFHEIRFARYNSVLMEFRSYLLGMFDVHGISKFVFFLCTRVSFVPLICVISVSKNLCGLVSMVSFILRW